MTSPPPSSKPERDSPTAEESPFSIYASTLSPINPVNAGYAVHNFVNMPSPQPVFTSPHVSFSVKGPIIQRFQKPESCNLERVSLNDMHTVETKSEIANITVPPSTTMDHLVPSHREDPSSNHASSTSHSVDELLVDQLDVSDCSNKKNSDIHDLNHARIHIPYFSVSRIEDSSSNKKPNLHREGVLGVDSDFNNSDIVEREVDITGNGNKAAKNSETPLYLIAPHTNDDILFEESPFGQEVPLHTQNDCSLTVSEALEDNSKCKKHMEPIVDALHELSTSADCGDILVTHDIVQKHQGSPKEILEIDDSNGLAGCVLHSCGAYDGLNFEAFDCSNVNQGCIDFLKVPGPFPCADSSLESISVSTFPDESIVPSSTESLNQMTKLSGTEKCKVSLHQSNTVKNLCNNTNSDKINDGSTATAPRPSGIGLHLNSIGSPVPSNYIARTYCAEKFLRMEKKQISVNALAGPENISCCNTENNVQLLDEQLVELSQTSSFYQQSLDVENSKNSEQLAVVDSCAIPGNISTSPLGVNQLEGSTQRSPPRKRKKASENDISKRCNCKRTKCLKLYCECFAAGFYCNDECFCLDCVNKPEYSDKVKEARDLKESRDPLAFAPKVVVTVCDAQEAAVNKRLTPTSARHKRGCKCKKSNCLKKYCECFQEGVGCTPGCRCKGCKNSFGSKDGSYGISETDNEMSQDGLDHKELHEDCLEKHSFGKNQEMKEMKNLMESSDHTPNVRLSPLTPNVQGLSEKEVPESQVPISYYPSPDSGSSALASFIESPRTKMSSIRNGISTRIKKNTSSVDCDSALLSKSKALSPVWDAFPDLIFSPLQCLSPPSTSATSSSSALSSKPQNSLKPSFIQGRVHAPVGHLHWHTSPVTPLPQHEDLKSSMESDYDSELLLLEDTPYVDPISPPPSVKMNSPNKKRVSPPKKTLHIVAGSGSSPSPLLRSGRKYVLRSVPAFPPLTPCTNDNNSNNNDNGREKRT